MVYDDNNGHSSLALLLLLKELHSPVELFKLTGACIAIEDSCHVCRVSRFAVSLACATLDVHRLLVPCACSSSGERRPSAID